MQTARREFVGPQEVRFYFGTGFLAECDPLEDQSRQVHSLLMRVRIDRERQERKIATGWFARARIPAYCLSLTIQFTEEERYLIRHTGIGRYVFFQAPIPPDVTDPDQIKKLKSEDFGLFLIRDLLGFGAKTLLAVWPDLIAADEGEAAARAKLEELAEHLARAGGTTESSVVYEI